MTGNGPVDTLLLIASVIGALAVIWAKGIKPAATVIGRIWHALRAMSDQWEKLDHIASQFEVNGGTTLVDRITLIENRQQDIMHQLEKILTANGYDKIEWPT